MKKYLLLLLSLSAAVLLCACAGQAEPPAADDLTLETMAPVLDEDEASEEPEASETDAAPESPASETDAGLDEEGYETAMSLIGHPAEELLDALGEPSDAQYATSCEEENAEDGMLFYDGFYVWTVRTAAHELIHDVYLLD